MKRAALQTSTLSLDRMSRLSTDLANERTLLAWVRTALAAARTAFSYMGLSAAGAGWGAELFTCACVMAALAIAFPAMGLQRYAQIKRILHLPDSAMPAQFDRVSVRPLVWLLLACSLASAVGVATHEWRN